MRVYVVVKEDGSNASGTAKLLVYTTREAAEYVLEGGEKVREAILQGITGE